jgi:hypothetical protein
MREERRRAAFEAAAQVWAGQATGNARLEEVLDGWDSEWADNNSGLRDEDVWDPAEEGPPYGQEEDYEDGNLDNIGYTQFIKNLEAQLLCELSNPGERSASTDLVT